MNIFTKAYNGLNLTPGQRALLKVLESLGYSALIAGLFAAYTLLSDSPTPDWGKALYTALGAIVLTFLLGLSKYFKAQGEPLLGTVIGFAAEETKQTFTAQAAKALAVQPSTQPITSNAYIPPDARQQIAALPTIRRPALSPNVDYQTAPMPAVANPQFVQPPIIQTPAWLHPNEATGMTEVPLQTTPPTAMHWGDSQTMPTVQQ